MDALSVICAIICVFSLLVHLRLLRAFERALRSWRATIQAFEEHANAGLQRDLKTLRDIFEGRSNEDKESIQ